MFIMKTGAVCLRSNIIKLYITYNYKNLLLYKPTINFKETFQ